MTRRFALLVTLMQRMWVRPLGLRRDVGLGLLEDLVGVGLGVIAPLLLKALVDALERPGDPRVLAGQIILFVLAWSSPSLIAAGKSVHTTRIVEALSADLAGALLRRQLPRLAAAKSGESGYCIALIERLPFSLQIVVDGLLWRAMPMMVQGAASLVVLAAIVSPADSLILVTALGLYLLVADIGARVYGRNVAMSQDSAALASTHVVDVVRNAKRVVFNGALDAELADLQGRCDLRRRAAMDLAQALARMSASQFLILCLGLAAMLWFSAEDAEQGRRSIGTFVLVQAYVLRLALPLAGLAITVRQSALAIETLADVFRLMGGEPAAVAAAEPRGALGVRLDSVSFHHPDGSAGVDAVSTLLQPGTTVALVGANGSGKSTLAQLMAGVLAPSQGRVTINGVDPSALDMARRRLYALYVPQFIGLFNRSLRSNLLYPPTHSYEDDLVERLKHWRFYENGAAIDLDMVIGDQGERLSGGQIQKLELARLIGVKASLLVLDESTSALDGPSARQIIRALRAALGSATLVLVTHDLEIAEQADHVLFLSRGRLAGSGAHRSLLRADTAYRALWETDHGQT